ncbi:transient receptor potential cation channel subfamily M member 2, partial [Austrofundulus limnaeus]|uniref:Transient receptor potential cation channel subfamily M member 2 n=1 Tax=Austrofundulus limnaeus TaxID=52670 RepID=A0A2I4D7W8_AUSLI
MKSLLRRSLLIAIFNFTFQEVQENTDKIWKFQRYELIKEYHSRPAAPPPFMILSHVCHFIRSVVLRRPPTRQINFKRELLQTEEEELLTWEALMKDRYLLSAQQELSQSVEGRILDTAQKVTTITEQLETEKETSSAAVLKRLAELEEQVIQSNKSLQWIMDALMSQGASAGEAQRQTAAVADESAVSLKNALEKESSFHVRSRQFHYPNCKITRFAVPEEKVPWEVSFSSYNPKYYDSENNTR